MRYVGTVILYNPNREEVISNINTYLPLLEKIYLIDNSENNNESLFSNIDKVEYHWNGGNIGIAAALNVAAKKAIEEKFDWLLTMDQDSKFKKGAFSILIDYVNNYTCRDKLAIVSPFHDTVLNDGVYPDSNTVDKPIIVMTSGNLVNLKIYTSVGGFKDWYFIDCVDFDFCLSIIRSGYEIHQVNKSILEHELGNTEKRKFLNKYYFVDNHNYIRRYYIVRNRHYINDEYCKDFPDYCKAEMRCTRGEVKRIVLFEKDKIRKLFYMYKGYRDYRKGIKGKLNEK